MRLATFPTSGTAEATAPEPAGLTVGDLLGMARRRLGLVALTMLAVLVLAGGYLVVQKPLYRSTLQLLIDPQQLQVVGKDIIRSDTSPSIDFANVDSQSIVITSASVLEKVVGALGLDTDPAFLPRGAAALPPEARRTAVLSALYDAITVRRLDNSLVFEITVANRDGEKAAKIANTLADVYLKQAALDRVQAAERASQTLLAQATSLRAKLDTAEQAVERYKAEHGLISTGDTGLLVTQQLKDLTTQMSLASNDVARQAARVDQANRLGVADVKADTVPEAVTSTVIAALRAQYARIAQEEASLAGTLGPEHPQLRQVRLEEQKTLTLITAELARIRASVQEDYRRAKANLAGLQAQAKTLTQSRIVSGEAEIGLRQLESEADAVRAVYNATLSRARELEQQQNIQTNNSRVISPALPPLRSTAPPKALVLAAAAAFGALLGLGLAFLLELAGRVVPSPARLGDLLDAPVLVSLARPPGRRAAAIPFAEGGPALAAAPADRQAMAVLAGQLRTGLARHLPVSLVALRLGGSGEAHDLVAALAGAWADLGEACLLSVLDDHGATGPVQRLSAAPAALAAAPARPRSPDSLWDDEPVFENAGATALASRGRASRPELVLVDATAVATGAGIPAAAIADAALVVADMGRVRKGEAEALRAALAAAGMPLLGIVAVEGGRPRLADLPLPALRRRKAA